MLAFQRFKLRLNQNHGIQVVAKTTKLVYVLETIDYCWWSNRLMQSFGSGGPITWPKLVVKLFLLNSVNQFIVQGGGELVIV